MYCFPKIPEQYWLTQFELKCLRCGHGFTILVPESGDVVMLRENEGVTVKWLPTYSVGGYLDLLVKLVPGYTRDTEVTMKTAKLFEDRLSEVAEKRDSGRPFRLEYARRTCPVCGSTDVEDVKETVLQNPPLDWLKIECSYTQSSALPW